MKTQRRGFLKYAFNGVVTLTFVSIIPTMILKECSQKTDQVSRNMNKLLVNKIESNGISDLKQAEELLESQADFQVIETINWSEYPYKPEVKFKMAYFQDKILLKYYVTEESVRAIASNVNDDVYKDSCVEFFISTKSDSSYYNFEFSCIGIPKASYGSGRNDRKDIDPDILNLIQSKSSLGDQPFEEKTGGHSWEMMLIIPTDCLVNDKDIQLAGLKAKANFYKCGDETVKPHFVSWSPIGTENPDFHQPVYFGELSFI